MRVARAIIEAPVVSFRYPHFLIGRQLSFDMPPPSTIYGHIASAVGDWLDPAKVRFAYTFTFESKGSDLEHQNIIEEASGSFRLDSERLAKNIAMTVQPHQRDFLYGCRLTLYLDPPELAAAFDNPAFSVVLGRSQDLARIASVAVIDLEAAEGAYLEKTLLPFSWRKSTGRGVTVLMPRYITPPPEREPYFERYIVLHDRIFAGAVDVDPHKRVLDYEGDTRAPLLIDPETPVKEGVRQGFAFHSFA